MQKITSIGRTRVGLIQFPGSNCDEDCVVALNRHFGIEVKKIWHRSSELPVLDAIVIPGGFSFGDYLRCGGLAALSPIMDQIRAVAKKGMPIIGICNGFQILVETHLLEGALLPNAHGRFVCQRQELQWTKKSLKLQQPINASINLPIAHGEGRFHADPVAVQKLQTEDRVLFTYAPNPNGSVGDIAGICDKTGRIWGMMPHPERAMEEITSGTNDGQMVWKAFFEHAMGGDAHR
jgi:phosphoribosylformylglycinamidine synthase I